MFEYVFAFVHLIVVLGVLVYGIVSLIEGNLVRGAFILLILALYYLLVLHKALKKEIARKRNS